MERGGESCVFVLRSLAKSNPSFVLKINRKREGDIEYLSREARKIKDEYEKIRKWYENELPGFIPEELLVISPGPRGEKKVIIAIQKFIDGDIKDLFSDFSKEDLLEILKQNDGLREEFKRFFLITKGIRLRTGEVIDILGERNLSIVGNNDGEKKLVFLDPHLIFSNRENGKIEREKKIEERMAYLGDVFNELEITSEAA